MKTPKPKPKKSDAPRRLSPAQWIEAEELYRSGWTQAQISDKYKVRIETVSRHMTKRSVKGGERAETMREELAAALQKKQREFAEAKAQRQIDSKEMLFKMNNALLATYAREFKHALDTGKGLAAMQGIAKALKDSVLALKVGREELYALLEIDDSKNQNELPDLSVASMTEEEENDLRSRVESSDEEDDDAAAAAMAEVVESVDRAAELASVR
jgi:hypothetical protein